MSFIGQYLLPSGTISTPSLNHLQGASSSSTLISNTAVSSSTTFLPFNSLVNACWNSSISKLQIVSLSPSFPKSSMTHLYSPASASSADRMSRVQTPSSCFIKNLKRMCYLSMMKQYCIMQTWDHFLILPFHP